MKALTITQPYATLVAIGAKRIETRDWNTRHRGPLAIHSSKGFSGVGGKRAFEALCAQQPFASVLTEAGKRHYAPLRTLKDMVEHEFMPRGFVIATCELVDCVPTWPDWATQEPYFTGQNGDSVWHVPPSGNERAFGDYTPGRFAWLLDNVQPLSKPIAVTGQLGLWEWEL